MVLPSLRSTTTYEANLGGTVSGMYAETCSAAVLIRDVFSGFGDLAVSVARAEVKLR